MLEQQDLEAIRVIMREEVPAIVKAEVPAIVKEEVCVIMKEEVPAIVKAEVKAAMQEEMPKMEERLKVSLHGDMEIMFKEHERSIKRDVRKMIKSEIRQSENRVLAELDRVQLRLQEQIGVV